ncbi:hypothetical protein [Tropicibacter sp. S64]
MILLEPGFGGKKKWSKVMVFLLAMVALAVLDRVVLARVFDKADLPG